MAVDPLLFQNNNGRGSETSPLFAILA